MKEPKSIFWCSRFGTEVDIELDWSAHAQIPSGSYTVRDLWNKEDLESIQVGDEAGEVFIGTLDVHDN